MKRKSHLEPSVPLHAQFKIHRRRPHPPLKRAYFSPQRKLRVPKKPQCFVQILTFKVESMICENEASVRGFLPMPRVEDVKTKLSCEASFKFQKLQMGSHVFNAAVPVHKVSQEMQNTIAQHQQRKEKVTRTVSSTARAV